MATRRDESQLCLPHACPEEHGAAPLEQRAAKVMSESEVVVLASELLRLIPEAFGELLEAVEMLAPGARRAGLVRRIRVMVAKLK